MKKKIDKKIKRNTLGPNATDLARATANTIKQLREALDPKYMCLWPIEVRCTKCKGCSKEYQRAYRANKRK